jgi:hypothetical protein
MQERIAVVTTVAFAECGEHCWRLVERFLLYHLAIGKRLPRCRIALHHNTRHNTLDKPALRHVACRFHTQAYPTCTCASTAMMLLTDPWQPV